MSGARLAPILVIDLCFPSSLSLIPFHCCLHHPSPLSLLLVLILHSRQISLHAVTTKVLAIQAWQSQLPQRSWIYMHGRPSFHKGLGYTGMAEPVTTKALAIRAWQSQLPQRYWLYRHGRASYHKGLGYTGIAEPVTTGIGYKGIVEPVTTRVLAVQAR